MAMSYQSAQQRSLSRNEPPPRADHAGRAWHSPRTDQPAQILVVDDEPIVRDTLTLALETAGDEVLAVDSGESALAILGSGVFDIVILDVGLPGISGFETLRQIRARSDVPVMMVTAAGTLTERVAGFDLGADDYLVKPLEILELSRRVRAILRRSRGSAPRLGDELIGPGGIVMRLRAHAVLVEGQEVSLTPKEFAVLRLLLERRGEVIHPDEISVKIWGYETFGSRNFVEAHVSRLRSKLTHAGADDVVTTMRGVGYRSASSRSPRACGTRSSPRRRSRARHASHRARAGRR